MSQSPSFTPVRSHVVALPVENIDTDQITPARFLKVTDRNGMAEACFADWRKDPTFVLNQSASKGAQVLVAGNNFGCGSSREHAAWALAAYGFRSVISSSFADIFRSNALKNGIVPVQVSAEVLRDLLARHAEQPDLHVEVDLQSQILKIDATAHAPASAIPFTIDAFARTCLLRGVDQLGYIATFATRIAAFEVDHSVHYNAQSVTAGESVPHGALS